MPAHRRTTIAIALTAAALAALTGAQAAAARTTVAVPGDIGALAFTGDDLVVASQPLGGGLIVQRLHSGAAARILLRDRKVDRDERVTLAGSNQALAVGLASASFTHSRVLAGPAGGPLREVLSCGREGLPGPVAVFGSRVAWGDLGCAGGTSSIVIGDADVTVAPRHIPVSGPPMTIVLGHGDGGLVVLPHDQDSSELRPFGAGAIGVPFAMSRFAMAALGILPDGTRVGLSGEHGADCGPARVFTVAPGSSDRRNVDLGGPVALGVCLGVEALGGTGDIPRVTADRIVALVVKEPAKGTTETFSVVSARADGGDRREIARGDDVRALGHIAVDGDRVAWVQPACFGGSEVVTDSLTSPGTYRVRHCRGEILTRTARVRDGRIAVRVRCPLGCNGSVDAQRLVRSARFAFASGTGTVRVRVALGARRNAHIRLRLHVANSAGLADSATIAVRR